MQPRRDIVTEDLGNDRWVVRLVGDHDLSTRQRLDSELAEILSHGTTLIIDLTEASFIDSSVLGALVAVSQKTEHDPNERYAIVAPAGSAADRLFQLTGVGSRFHVFATLNEALAAN
jgi:anti-sigma B factor antagonist